MPTEVEEKASHYKELIELMEKGEKAVFLDDDEECKEANEAIKRFFEIQLNKFKQTEA